MGHIKTRIGPWEGVEGHKGPGNTLFELVMKAKEAEQCVLESNLKLLFSCMILGHSYSLSALFCVCFWACGAIVIAHLQVFKGCVDGDRLHFQHAFRVLLVVCVFLVCM